MSPTRIITGVVFRVFVAFFIVELTAAEFSPKTIPAPRLAPLPPNANAPKQDLSHKQSLPEVPGEVPKEIMNVAVSHGGISFEELQAIARQNNPILRQKYAMIAAAQGGRTQAGLYPNPTMTAAGDNIGTGTGPGKYGLTLTQEVVLAKKKKLDRSIANVDVQVAQREYEMECLRLQNQVKIASYRYLGAQLMRHVHDYSTRISGEFLESADRHYRAGKTKAVDVLQFRATHAEAEVHYRNSLTEERNAWTQLVAVLGTPDMPQQPIAGSLLDDPTPLDWETSWCRLQQMSPQMQIACLKSKQAQITVDRQRAERVGNVTFIGTFSRDITGEGNVPFVGISVPLKIYDRNQGNIAKAQAEWAAANRSAESVRLELYRSLADSFKDLENSRELIKAFKTKILPNTYQALMETHTMYMNNETASYIELYHQRRSMIETSLSFIDALELQLVSAALIEGMLLGSP